MGTRAGLGSDGKGGDVPRVWGSVQTLLPSPSSPAEAGSDASPMGMFLFLVGCLLPLGSL